jgi:hypothetical protein
VKDSYSTGCKWRKDKEPVSFKRERRQPEERRDGEQRRERERLLVFP